MSKRPDAGVIPFTPRYCIGACMGHREFFVQKAMGWVLRDYARTDPGEVRRYVALVRGNKCSSRPWPS